MRALCGGFLCGIGGGTIYLAHMAGDPLGITVGAISIALGLFAALRRNYD